MNTMAFVMTSLIRYLASKGTIDLNDFVDAALGYADEPGMFANDAEKAALKEFIISTPRYPGERQIID